MHGFAMHEYLPSLPHSVNGAPIHQKVCISNGSFVQGIKTFCKLYSLFFSAPAGQVPGSAC